MIQPRKDRSHAQLSELRSRGLTVSRATLRCVARRRGQRDALPEGDLTMPVRSYVTIPSDDEEFRSTVERLGAEIDDVDRLRELLAAVYPNAHVSAQSPLGSLSGKPTRLYIYRDGVKAEEEQ
jgi:hypothetical protein